MSRPFSPRGVIRHLPLPLVRRFLVHEDVGGPDWEALADGNFPTLFRLWLDLPPAGTGPT